MSEVKLLYVDLNMSFLSLHRCCPPHSPSMAAKQMYCIQRCASALSAACLKKVVCAQPGIKDQYSCSEGPTFFYPSETYLSDLIDPPGEHLEAAMDIT